MRKYLLSTLGIFALTMMFCVGTTKVYAFDEVIITVVSESDGSPIEWGSFEAELFNPPGESFGVFTHGDGLVQIEGMHVGDKISFSNDELSSSWTEVKAEGTVVICRENAPR